MHEHIARALKDFIATDFLNGKDSGLDGDTLLLDWGIIDSVSLVMILGFVKKQFGVDVPPAELAPSNLKTINAMAAMIERIGGAQSAG